MSAGISVSAPREFALIDSDGETENEPGLVLRSILKDGAPWFIAKDVCDALGLSNRSMAVAGLDEDEKGHSTVDTPGGPQSLITVNESGLYALILRSRKPQAKAFRKWVTGTVLPALRQDGLYIAGQEQPAPEDQSLPDLMAQLAVLQAKVDALKEKQVRAWALSRERREEENEARKAASRVLRRSVRSAPRVR
ncbi:BRO-N domain-containing protein [Methylibium petroleiphilum]|uniref:BRO-N domain-containing protein n=1 Tax=Methylibium petroleiphilum TaxID=105560 RepID=UPI003D2DDF4C